VKKIVVLTCVLFFLACSVLKKNATEEYPEADSGPVESEPLEERSLEEVSAYAKLQASYDEVISKLVSISGEIENLHASIEKLKISQLDLARSIEERILLVEEKIQHITLSDQRELEKYKNASSLYQFAKQQVNKDDRKAVLAFKRLIEVFPKSTLVDDSHFWLGEIYFKRQDFQGALIEFDTIRANYPQSNVFIASLFKEALCFNELNENVKAQSLFEYIVENYPDHAFAHESKKYIQK